MRVCVCVCVCARVRAHVYLRRKLRQHGKSCIAVGLLSLHVAL